MLPGLASELGLDQPFAQGRFEPQLGIIVEIIRRGDERLDSRSAIAITCNRTRRRGSVETCQLLNQALALLNKMIELRVAARNRRRIGADLLEYSIFLASEVGPDRVPGRALPVQQCIHRVSSSNVAPVCTGVYLRPAFWREIRENRPGSKRASVVHSGKVQEKTVLTGRFFQTLEAARFAAVAGFHVDMKDQRIRVGLPGAQPRNVLGRLVVLNLRIPQSCRNQHWRGIPGLDVVITRGTKHVTIKRFLAPNPP